MALLFCCFGIYLAFRIGAKNKFYFRLFLALTGVHIICLFFGLIITGGADARQYYQSAVDMTPASWLASFGQGTDFIVFFTYPLIHLFGLSYTGGYIFYSCFGLWGYYFIIKAIDFLIKKYNLLYKKEYFYLLLLPGLHIWNVAIGKDSLIFFSIALFFAGVLYNKWIWIGFGGALMGLVRSPVLALFIVGLVFGNIMLNKKISIAQKVFICICAGVLLYLLLPVIEARLNLENVDYDSISDTIDQRLSANQAGGSSIDMTNASYPAKVFGFLFRPLFFDAHSGLMLYSSCENLIWLLMTINVFWNFITKTFRRRYSAIYFSILMSFLFPVLAQSSTLSNLGIAVRMKTMYFTPLILMFFLSRDTILRNTIKRRRSRIRRQLAKR